MSNSLTRKVRRQLANKNKKETTKQLKKMVSLFGLLPDVCSGCYTPFDKKSREDHMTWQVTVHEAAEDVLLVCPACQENNRGKNA
tara:strand:- start:75 stop:329 length:255 start_codon:yes stop_codon:yes gene_type:complete